MVKSSHVRDYKFINVAILNNTVLMDVLKNPILERVLKKIISKSLWMLLNLIIIFIIIKYSK